MRQVLRFLGIGFWSLLSINIVIGIFDWFGRWDWLTATMAAHPHLAAVVRTPFAYLALLGFGFLFLLAERKLKQPRIVARFTNSRIIPNLHTTPMQAVFDTEAKKAGWDEQKLDWHWLVEIQLANDSDIPTTIEGIEVQVKAGPTILQAKHTDDIGSYIIQRKTPDMFSSSTHEALPSLLEKIKGVPLTRGIGHRGWLSFDILKASQKEMNQPAINVWLVDALQNEHKVEYERKSDQKWDASFDIFKESE